MSSKKIIENMSEISNPYTSDDDKPQLKNSVVVFLDVLGYSDKVLIAENSGKGQEFLLEFHKTIGQALKWIEPNKEGINQTYSSKSSPKDLYKLKSFSDNIVLGYPIRDDAESELGHIFSMLSFFQLEMVNSGYFLRGAISIGEFFADEKVVYGKALIDAYKAETQQARDPRIILTDTAKQAVEDHLKYYRNPKASPQSRNLYRDSDGQIFLNYLNSTLIGLSDDYGPLTDEIDKHKISVENCLETYISNPSIWSKYSWVANYHNFFCSQHSQIDKNHRVSVSNYQMKPTNLIEM